MRNQTNIDLVKKRMSANQFFPDLVALFLRERGAYFRRSFFVTFLAKKVRQRKVERVFKQIRNFYDFTYNVF